MDVQSPSEALRPPLMQAGGALSPDAIAALCAHPRFPDAMRAVLAGNVSLYRGNRVLNYLGFDRGRLLVGLFALHLHLSRRPADPASGLTAHRLKALCVEQDICSPGRAGALLSLMRLFGYVEPAPGPADRRSKRLVPTMLLLTTLRQRWRLLFGAMAAVLPEAAAAALTALERDDFLSALVRMLVEHFRAGIRLLEFAPELGPFADRNAGLVILFSLIVAGEADDTMPPTRPVHLPVSDLARRFSISRTQVLRLLRDAAAGGFIERPEATRDAPITLLPPLSIAIRRSVATMFLLFAHCARAALAEVDGTRPGRPAAG